MDSDDAKEILRDIARFGTVGLSKHCRERMEERNVNMDDILNVLLWGIIIDIEKTDSDISGYRLNIKGEDLEGDELTLVAVLNAATNLVCVTVC